jgi:hypothetical protein
MKPLHIEWQHLDVDGKTCRRCADTGKTLTRVVEELRSDLEPRGIRITVTERKLAKDQIALSNRLFFNGRALENILPDVTVSENSCLSCAEVCGCGSEVNCLTIIRAGTVYEAIPATLIREAALATIGLANA